MKSLHAIRARPIRLLWLTSVIAILPAWLITVSSGGDFDGKLFLLFQLLTFPVGLNVAMWLPWALPSTFSSSSIWSAIVLWSVSAALAYFQWFWLVPRALRPHKSPPDSRQRGAA